MATGLKQGQAGMLAFQPRAVSPVASSNESGGQAFAALGSPCVNDGSATASRHAGAEPVPAGTLESAWLERTFHFTTLNLDSVDRQVFRRRSRQEANCIENTAFIQDLAPLNAARASNASQVIHRTVDLSGTRSR